MNSEPDVEMTSYRLRAGDEVEGNRLEGRIVLVTGAADDIGRAVAMGCAREGATVLLLDRRRKGLDAVYDRIVSAGLPEPIEIQETLGTLDDERAAFLAAQIDTAFGRLDAIVHAAGETAPLAPLEHFPPDLWNLVLHTRITAPWILNRTLLPLLRASSEPRIVFTTGSAGRVPRAYFGATAIAWSALDSMAGILTEEFECNESIRVFSVDPGEIDTEARTRWFPGQDPGALPKPEDLADAFVFLVSKESARFVGPRCAVKDGTLQAG